MLWPVNLSRTYRLANRWSKCCDHPSTCSEQTFVSKLLFQSLWKPVILFWIQFVPNPVILTFLTIRLLNFVTIRPTLVPIVPTVVPIFVPVILFTLLHLMMYWKLAHLSNHLTLKCSLRALDWTAACSHAGSVHKCAPVIRPPVCISPTVSGIPTRVCPYCGFLTGLCFLRVVVPSISWNPFFPFLPCFWPFPLYLFLPLPLPGFPFPLPLSFLPLSLPGLLLPLSSGPDHPLIWLFCKYSVFFQQSLAMWP